MIINSTRKFVRNDGSRVTFIEVLSTLYKNPDESLKFIELKESSDGVMTGQMLSANDGATAINRILANVTAGDLSWRYENESSP